VPDRFEASFARLEDLYAPSVMDLRAVTTALANALPAFAEHFEERAGVDDALLRWASLANPIMPRTAAALESVISSRVRDPQTGLVRIIDTLQVAS